MMHKKIGCRGTQSSNERGTGNGSHANSCATGYLPKRGMWIYSLKIYNAATKAVQGQKETSVSKGFQDQKILGTQSGPKGEGRHVREKEVLKWGCGLGSEEYNNIYQAGPCHVKKGKK